MLVRRTNATKLLDEIPKECIIEQIYHVANSTGLFDEGDIKLKINPFQKYSVDNMRRFYPCFFSN